MHLAPNVSLRMLPCEPSIQPQAHRNVLDPYSIELGREGKQSMRDSIEHNGYSSYI